MKKIIIIAVAAAVVFGGGGYWVGTMRAAPAAPAGSNSRAAFGNAAAGGNGMTRFAGRGGANGGGFAAGEVVSKDATSLTIKLSDGSSRIVILASSTEVMTAVRGAINDVLPGAQVTVQGSQNSDGSITAQAVQVRPEGAARLR